MQLIEIVSGRIAMPIAAIILFQAIITSLGWNQEQLLAGLQSSDIITSLSSSLSS